MGSCNSENSASMNSEELSELIGHNYANANIPHQHDNFALHFDLEIEHSLYTTIHVSWSSLVSKGLPNTAPENQPN